jgi:hypothetical protein
MHWLISALASLGLIAAVPSIAATQVVRDSGSTSLGRLVAELSPSTRIRVATGGEHWTGRVAARQPDSLTLVSRFHTRTFPLRAVDTLWIRSERHTALAAGAGFGALMFGLLQLGHGGERSMATQLGAILFLGGAGAGLLIDAASDRWSRRFPE